MRRQHVLHAQPASQAGVVFGGKAKALRHHVACVAGAQGVQRRQGVCQKRQFAGLLLQQIFIDPHGAALEPQPAPHIHRHPKAHHQQQRPGNDSDNNGNQQQKGQV